MDLSGDEWHLCSMHDPAGRRGIWYRRLPDDSIEIRAGREGDDAEAIVPMPLADAVADCLNVGALALECFENLEAVRRREMSNVQRESPQRRRKG